MFMLDLTTFTVTEITPFKTDGSGNLDVNSPILPINWGIQAENYFVLQDNQSLPIIFNGSLARRSNQSLSEVPVGNVMCYCQGRLTVALPDRQSFRIGDLVFGSSGTPALQYRDAMLRYTENNYYNEGGDFVARVFGAPSAVGPILAMKSGAQGDTALGQGPLVVFTPYTVFTVQLPFDRTTWKNLANPIQTVNPIYGALGQDSTVLVNSDIWYRAIDGIRSYISAQRQFNGSEGNTPQSSEIDDEISVDTPELLEYGSAVLFNNRLLMTISPVNSPYGVYHRGLAVLDFNLISSLRGSSSPAWEGIWSGLRVLKIVKGIVNRRERCFIYNLNASNQIELWELTTGDLFDNGSSPISWSVDLRSYNCGDSDAFKRLETGRIIVSNLVGSLSYTVRYRTDESPCYQLWSSGTVCSKYRDCGGPKTTTTNGPFTVPALNATVVVTLTTTAGMNTFNSAVVIGGFSFTITLVNSMTQVTLKNTAGVTPGTIVPSGASVSYTGFDCTGPHTYREQERTPIKLGMPPDDFDTIAGRKFRTNYEVQPRIEFTGYGWMRQFRVYNLDEAESLSPEPNAT
jgi:hypothetical protein